MTVTQALVIPRRPASAGPVTREHRSSTLHAGVSGDME
jgi:hypothetical protein